VFVLVSKLKNSGLHTCITLIARPEGRVQVIFSKTSLLNAFLCDYCLNAQRSLLQNRNDTLSVL